MSGLPAFEAFREEKDTPAGELARQLMLAPVALKTCNGLRDARVLAAGAWELVLYLRAAAS